MSPYRQSAFRGVFSGYLFHGARRLAANAPFVVPPFAVGEISYFPTPSLAMHYGRLTPPFPFPSFLLFGLSSQATPCILGRKRKTTTIIQSRGISTRSRIVVNTMHIRSLSLVTALACGRPLRRIEKHSYFRTRFSPSLAGMLVLLTMSVRGGDTVVSCSSTEQGDDNVLTTQNDICLSILALQPSNGEVRSIQMLVMVHAGA